MAFRPVLRIRLDVFELIATTASPRGWYSRASAANPGAQVRTNGSGCR